MQSVCSAGRRLPEGLSLPYTPEEELVTREANVLKGQQRIPIQKRLICASLAEDLNLN